MDLINIALAAAAALSAVAALAVAYRARGQARTASQRMTELNALLGREIATRHGAEASAAAAAAATLQAHVGQFVENMSDAFYALDNDWRFVYANKKAAEFLNAQQADLIGNVLWDCLPEAAVNAIRQVYENAKSTGTIQSIPRRAFRRQWYDSTVYPHDAGLAVFFQNITSRHVAEVKLEQKVREQTALAAFSISALSAESFHALLNRAIHLARDVLKCDYGSIFTANPARDSVQIVGNTGWDEKISRSYKLSDLPERSLTRLIMRTDGPVRFSNFSQDGRFVLSEEILKMGMVSGIGTIIRSAGDSRVIFYMLSKVERTFTDEEEGFLQALGNLIGLLIERDQALQRLSLRERALEAINQGIIITDHRAPGAPVIYTNPAFAALTKYALEEVVGRSSTSFIAHEADALSARAAKAFAEKRPWQSDMKIKRKDGTTFLDNCSTSVILGTDNEVEYVVAVHEDVTELRQREELLLEAQKMESVGQLTGGIAHDFNNLLTAIRSNAEDLMEDLKDNKIQHSQAEIVLKAADRGAGLVAQLMAFARKQELKPQVVDVNHLLESFTKLLRSTLESSIAIEVRTEERLPSVYVDPARLESALLNLSINARDAMSNNGTLTIETMYKVLDAEYARENLDVPPGPYVLIAVTDTGTGMPKEVIEKAFTPFFTTKEVGKGTGLGLSMVYGFVKQSGGNAKIYSELGLGTVIKIYLPALDQAATDTDTRESQKSTASEGRASILLVEDDDLVRQSISNKLTGLGYDVMTACNAHEAIETLKRMPRFDLVFTDIVMPGPMNGADLVREVRRRWPRMNVLMTSGYTESTVLGKIKLPEDVKLLSKPYSNAELSTVIRTAIAGADTAA